MKQTWILMTALAVACGAAEASAQDYGDPDAGLAYASRVCAVCHAIEKGDRRSPNTEAPSFDEIAHTPGVTAMALTAMLLTSHRTMPNLIIPEEDRANVIAYILSLKK